MAKPAAARNGLRTAARALFTFAICLGAATAQSNGSDAGTASANGTEAAAEYVIGPEDTLIIQARDVEEMPKTPVRVDLAGDIRLPLIGTVHAGGLTVPELEAAIAKELETYIIKPEVVVSISEFKSQPVSVLGAVRNPGILQVQGRKTLVETISMAGGLREDAGQRIIISRRATAGYKELAGGRLDDKGQYMVASISVDSILKGGDPAANIPIMPNDIITVPLADLVYVLGQVRKPGGFTIRKEEQISALLAVSMAEGLLPAASAKNVRVMRREPGSTTRTEIAVNLKRIMEGDAPDVPLQPDDIVFVPSSIPKNAVLRSLESAIQIGTGLVIWRR